MEDLTGGSSKQSAPTQAGGTPWKCRPITPFIDCIDDFGLFKIEPVVAGQTIGDFIDGEDAIARRVAACLNACAGFTTPDLEGGIRDKRHRHEIIADLVAANKQRDELAECLRIMLDEDAFSDQAIAEARALLAAARTPANHECPSNEPCLVFPALSS